MNEQQTPVAPVRTGRGRAAASFLVLAASLVVVAVAVALVVSRGVDDERAVAPSPSPTVTAAPSPTAPGQTAGGSSLARARAAMQAPGADVVVLGDSTGDDDGEWVQLWARSLGSERGAELLVWGAGADRYDSPEALGGVAADVTVWNGSVSGSRASYALERLDRMLPDGADLVLLSYGHNHTVDDVAEVSALIEAVQRRAPGAVVVVVLQNPQVGDANAAVREAVATLAAAQDVATIGVDEAFLEDGRPLEALLVDLVHPSDEGSQVWARTVESALEG